MKSQSVIRWAAVASLLAGVSAVAVGDEKPKNPFSGDKAVAEQGGSLFNQFCSHCHGQWAEQGERPRDLRRLNIRYGDDAISMFYQTVNAGRLDKGMPVWKGVLNDETIWKIYTFLETVQSED